MNEPIACDCNDCRGYCVEDNCPCPKHKIDSKQLDEFSVKLNALFEEYKNVPVIAIRNANITGSISILDTLNYGVVVSIENCNFANLSKERNL